MYIRSQKAVVQRYRTKLPVGPRLMKMPGLLGFMEGLMFTAKAKNEDITRIEINLAEMDINISGLYE